MSRDPNCIFCKIIAVEVPASVIYEDESILVLLDVAPLSEGHVLIIPREHDARLSDVSAEVSAAIGARLPALGRALMKVTGADAYNLLINEGHVAGQVVPHVHVHLIPRTQGDGLGYRWNAGSYPAGRAEQLAVAFQKALSEQK